MVQERSAGDRDRSHRIRPKRCGTRSRIWYGIVLCAEELKTRPFKPKPVCKIRLKFKVTNGRCSSKFKIKRIFKLCFSLEDIFYLKM